MARRRLAVALKPNGSRRLPPLLLSPALRETPVILCVRAGLCLKQPCKIKNTKNKIHTLTFLNAPPHPTPPRKHPNPSPRDLPRLSCSGEHSGGLIKRTAHSCAALTPHPICRAAANELFSCLYLSGEQSPLRAGPGMIYN